VYGYRKHKVIVSDHAFKRYRERRGMKTRKKLFSEIEWAVNELIGYRIKFSDNGNAFILFDSGYTAVLRLEGGVLVVSTIILRGGKREVERVAAC